MLKLSKKVDYGLILLSHIGQETDPASAREYAQRSQLPPPMVANILKDLTSAGMLTSTRGAQGGYILAKPTANISLADVILALEGPISLVECVGETSSCRLMDCCPTQDPVQVIHRKLEEFMHGFTLDEILKAPVTPDAPVLAGAFTQSAPPPDNGNI